jgi:hypothetical protein
MPMPIKPYKIKMIKKVTAYITASALAVGSLALYVKKMKLFKTVDKQQEKEQ